MKCEIINDCYVNGKFTKAGKKVEIKSKEEVARLIKAECIEEKKDDN